ncbi:hypothetical protein MKZ38_008579 [Zalerion maritima]|uniref:Calcineurin-like phosphoesterase domain-containing protein n=1 Tax=Zalerion maritima TaxID=339359 RepID=A0AAD5WVZ7_9PEZI|nr:hypothetical protein MKZ38_008579 [Zalerion maritima]
MLPAQRNELRNVNKILTTSPQTGHVQPLPSPRGAQPQPAAQTPRPERHPANSNARRTSTSKSAPGRPSSTPATFAFPAAAPYLIPAGDHWTTRGSRKGASRSSGRRPRGSRRSFWVLGNHEFYEPGHGEGIGAAKRMEREVNAEERKWFEEQMKEIHEENQAQAQAQLNGGEKRRRRKVVVVVVTHHAPSTTKTSGERRVGNPWASAYATDFLGIDPDEGGWVSKLLPGRAKREGGTRVGVKYWIFGHTHFSTQFEKGGVKVLANQRGYVFATEKPRRRRRSLEGGEWEFDPEATFEV